MIERATGVRPALPQYASEIEAKRELVRLGGLEAAVSSVLGPPQHDLRLCSDGDIVLSSLHGEHFLGVAVGRRFFFRRVDKAMVCVDLELALRWWPCQA